MRILAFDTSSAVSAVAVVDGERTLAEDDAPCDQLHGETLAPRVRAAMERARLSFQELDLIGVGIGPGSFTGLRVGLATAKGLALATRLPLRGVGSLAVIARAALGSEDSRERAVSIAVPIADARRGEIFVGAYAHSPGDALRVLLAPSCAAPADAAALVRKALDAARVASEVVLCGGGASAHGEAFALALGGCVRSAGAEAAFPCGRFVAAEARSLFAREGPSDLATLEPLYLRQAEITLPSSR